MVFLAFHSFKKCIALNILAGNSCHTVLSQWILKDKFLKAFVWRSNQEAAEQSEKTRGGQ